jgi:hypothetical protein
MKRVGNRLIGQTPWTALVDGDDIVVRNIIATCFGGGHDAGDNGQTESGVHNDGRDPSLLGVALPIRSLERATAGSPLAFPRAHIPWLIKVKVWKESDGEDTAIICAQIDNGPDVLKYPTHALDLTVAGAHHFAPSIPLHDLANEFELSGLSYRIVGAAQYAPTA